jgi:hypothetical protein
MSVVAIAALLEAIPIVEAFQPSPILNWSQKSVSASSATLWNDVGNGITSQSDIPAVSPADVTAKDLRSIKVTNADGVSVPLGNAMGRGTSVVVFLRHLG